MAIVKGVYEKVHLPLYDSLFVRPGKQLRDLVSSNVLKFFVNIQGKTKLETNMQSSALLPHWNTFEARALRVVISDLPEMNCNGAYEHEFDCDEVAAARKTLNAFHYAVDDAKCMCPKTTRNAWASYDYFAIASEWAEFSSCNAISDRFGMS